MVCLYYPGIQITKSYTYTYLCHSIPRSEEPIADESTDLLWWFRVYFTCTSWTALFQLLEIVLILAWCSISCCVEKSLGLFRFAAGHMEDRSYVMAGAPYLTRRRSLASRAASPQPRWNSSSTAPTSLVSELASGSCWKYGGWLRNSGKSWDIMG